MNKSIAILEYSDIVFDRINSVGRIASHGVRLLLRIRDWGLFCGQCPEACAQLAGRFYFYALHGLNLLRRTVTDSRQRRAPFFAFLALTLSACATPQYVAPPVEVSDIYSIAEECHGKVIFEGRLTAKGYAARVLCEWESDRDWWGP